MMPTRSHIPAVFLSIILVGSAARCSDQKPQPEVGNANQENNLSRSEITEGEVEEVVNGYGFTEGPLWLPSEKQFIFSDIPADTIYTESGKVFRTPSGKSNGLTLDPEGRLVICEHWNRRVIRLEKDGTVTVLAERFEGKKLNSPNDLVLRSDGSLSHPRTFATGLIPDGMKVDVNGNVWCTSRYEVVVFRPDGSQLGSITFPQKTANLAFGGEDSRTLIVTARKGVYRVRTKIAGLHPGKQHP